MVSRLPFDLLSITSTWGSVFFCFSLFLYGKPCRHSAQLRKSVTDAQSHVCSMFHSHVIHGLLLQISFQTMMLY